MNFEGAMTAMVSQGGPGSGPHKGVDAAIDAYNTKVRAKMHPKKECDHTGTMINPYAKCSNDSSACAHEAMPFQNVFNKKYQEAMGAATGAPLLRAGVKAWPSR